MSFTIFSEAHIFYLCLNLFLSRGSRPYSFVPSSPAVSRKNKETTVPITGTRFKNNHLPVLPMSCQRRHITASDGHIVIRIYKIKVNSRTFWSVFVELLVTPSGSCVFERIQTIANIMRKFIMVYPQNSRRVLRPSKTEYFPKHLIYDNIISPFYSHSSISFVNFSEPTS